MTRYRVPVTELDRVHVPREQQVEQVPEHAPPEYVEPEELDRARLLGVTGAGRLRPRR